LATGKGEEAAMKIIVCLKQVPKNDSVLRVNEDGTWIQDRDLSYEINESDQYALEAALQLKEKVGGEVIGAFAWAGAGADGDQGGAGARG
jgi:electron transfer flavoprotein alpha/beta subunit